MRKYHLCSCPTANFFFSPVYKCFRVFSTNSTTMLYFSKKILKLDLGFVSNPSNWEKVLTFRRYRGKWNSNADHSVADWSALGKLKKAKVSTQICLNLLIFTLAKIPCFKFVFPTTLLSFLVQIKSGFSKFLPSCKQSKVPFTLLST